MSKIPDKAQLAQIRAHLIDNVFRNEAVMFSDFVWCDTMPDVTSMLAALYNMLHLAVTGEEYDYFFHWCNKIGADCDDDYFSFVFDGEDAKDD